MKERREVVTKEKCCYLCARLGRLEKEMERRAKRKKEKEERKEGRKKERRLEKGSHDKGRVSGK